MPPRKQAPQPLPTTITTEGDGLAKADQAMQEEAAREEEKEFSQPPAGVDTGDGQPPDTPYPADLADVTLDESALPVARNPNWVVVPALSDDEFQVETAKLDGFQYRMSLMRFRLRGELLSQVVTLPGVTYQEATGKFQNRG